MTDTHIEDEKLISLYEITYLVRKEEDASFISALLAKHGGEIEREEPVRKIQLAYPIKKEVFAFLGVIRFRMDSSRLAELNADLRLDAHSLRHLVTHSVSFQVQSRPDNRAYEGRPSGKAPEARRPLTASSPPQTLSNEALQEKIEEILQ